MASVTFENVTKRFDGDVVAVDDLDLAIDDGEFMVLLGPSGCGKTTALRMIAGLEDITDGQAAHRRPVVNDVDPAKRDVSMVFQSYALYPHMTVRRNIESPLLVRRYPVDGPDRRPASSARAERDERVDEAARVLGLDDLLGRKPAALSGGQRQRVALARAFVGRPQAFLMDEPLSNLDAKLRAQTRLELVDLHRRVETTVVYVTHDQVEAMTMADRIAIMSAGRLQQVGTPQEVYDGPGQPVRGPVHRHAAHEHHAGHGHDRGRRPAVDVGGGRVPVPPGRPTALDDGQPVVVGVRPEHLELAADGPSSTKVRAVEWLGHECLVFGTIGEAPVVVRQVGHGRASTAGGTTRLAVDPADVHLFDPDTTERLDVSSAARLLRRRRPPALLGEGDRRWRCSLLAPSLVVFVAFFYRPFLNLLYWGTFESRRNGAFFEDVGLRQYREQLTSDDFREGLWHSVQFVLYTVPAGLVLGMLLAVAAHRRLKGIKVFQAIFASTLASSVAVTSVIFFYLFNPVVGVVPGQLAERPDTAMFAVSLSSIWQNLGLSFVIVLAGLQSGARRGHGGGHARRLRRRCGGCCASRCRSSRPS